MASTEANQLKLSNPIQDIVVAVVDTGVDYEHDDLRNVMWENPAEIAGNGIDDDGNGYVDDVHGINILTEDPKLRGNPGDSDGHGTHIAGIIGAERGNGLGCLE